jgi:outer membrane protein
MKKYFGLLMLLGVFYFNTKAQNKKNEVKSFSLAQAIEFAKQNNYSLKNNKLDVIASEKKVNEILSLGLPQINASGNFINNTTIATNFINFGGKITPLQFGQPFSSTASITGTQLLFDGGFLMGVKAASEYVNLAKLNVNRGEIETEVNVTKAYYLALLLQTNALLIDTNILTMAKTKNDLEKTYANGLIEKTDFDRVTLQYSSLLLQRERIYNSFKVALMVLELQLGINVSDSINLTDKLGELYQNTKAPSTESKSDYNKLPEYQILNQQLRLQDLDRKRILFGYAPSLSGVVSTQQNAFAADFSSLGNTWYPGTYWGLNLNIPVFDGLRKNAQLQQSKISISQTENNIKNLENAIDQKISSTKMAFELANRQVKIQEDNLKLAQEIYDRVNIKYKNGVGSSLDLTNSQNDLANARQTYLSTIYDYFSAQIELRRAYGDIK